jgi:hypothetical protein
MDIQGEITLVGHCSQTRPKRLLPLMNQYTLMNFGAVNLIKILIIILNGLYHHIILEKNGID